MGAPPKRTVLVMVRMTDIDLKNHWTIFRERPIHERERIALEDAKLRAKLNSKLWVPTRAIFAPRTNATGVIRAKTRQNILPNLLAKPQNYRYMTNLREIRATWSSMTVKNTAKKTMARAGNKL